MPTIHLCRLHLGCMYLQRLLNVKWEDTIHWFTPLCLPSLIMVSDPSVYAIIENYFSLGWLTFFHGRSPVWKHSSPVVINTCLFNTNSLVSFNSSTQLPLNVTDHVLQLRQVSTYLHGSPSQQRSHSELEEIIKVFNIICMLQGVHLFIIIIGKYPKFPIS